MQVCKVAFHWLELIIREHDGDFETYGDICTYQCLEVLEYVAIFMVSSLPADPNVMCLGMVIRNGIPATFMLIIK